MDMGSVAILNVAGGDVRVSFDPGNIAEKIRAARIIREMLRRGYALLVEVERNGDKAYERALDFDDTKHEYIIADYDPTVQEQANGQGEQTEERVPDVQEEATPRPRKGGRKGIPAHKTRAVAVARSAGG